MEKESFCDLCGDPDESLYHVAFNCSVARRFWAEVKKVEGVPVPNLHPSAWAADILQPSICSAELAALVVCGAWTLWTGRNARRHGCKVWEPRASVRFISSMLEELASLKVPKVPKPPRKPVKWCCPEEGWFKVNTDAGFDGSKCLGSSGVVIRNHNEEVQAAAAWWLDDVLDVLTAEAMVAKEGLELATEMGCDKIIL